MIPTVLTAPPAPVRADTPTWAGLAKAVGALLLVGALAGAFSWYLVFSPFSFRRWSSYDIPPQIVINEPGTFVLYEELPGAASSTTASDLRASVLSIGGKKIDGKSLTNADGTSSETYQSPFHNGRGIASFTIDKPGTYNVFAFSSATASRPLTVATAPKLALAPQGRPGWFGSMFGLVPLVIVPLLLAVLLFVVARRLRPPLTQTPRSAAPGLG